MVKTVSLLMALSSLLCPVAESRNEGEYYEAKPLFSADNYAIIDKTEGGVPIRFDANEANKDKRCPHKSKDIKDCDRMNKFNLPKRARDRERFDARTVTVRVREWEFSFYPIVDEPATLEEPPITEK